MSGGKTDASDDGCEEFCWFSSTVMFLTERQAEIKASPDRRYRGPAVGQMSWPASQVSRGQRSENKTLSAGRLLIGLISGQQGEAMTGLNNKASNRVEPNRPSSYTSNINNPVLHFEPHHLLFDTEKTKKLRVGVLPSFLWKEIYVDTKLQHSLLNHSNVLIVTAWWW